MGFVRISQSSLRCTAFVLLHEALQRKAKRTKKKVDDRYDGYKNLSERQRADGRVSIFNRVIQKSLVTRTT